MKTHAILERISVGDYLAGEQKSEVRHEYVAGHLFATGGGSRSHNLISGNIYTVLREQLRGGPCHAFIADMKVNVKSVGAFYYPDLVVSCDPGDTHEFSLSSPVLIMEVLSATTETTDRREKLLAYQSLASLHEYVLVSQTQRQIEVYRRMDGTNWNIVCYEACDTVHLKSIGLDLAMDAVYEEVACDK